MSNFVGGVLVAIILCALVAGAQAAEILTPQPAAKQRINAGRCFLIVAAARVRRSIVPVALQRGAT